MSNASLYALCAKGGEDSKLTGNPDVSFWKICFRQYTNFALETAEEGFKGGVGFGRSMSVAIAPERADLLMHADLVFTLPPLMPDRAKGVQDVHWVNSIGYAFIRSVKITAGGAVLAQQYGESMYIWSELNRDANHALGELTGRRYTVAQLIEDAKAQRTYYVSLDTIWDNTPGNAYPLQAARDTPVTITVESRHLVDLWVSRGGDSRVPPLNRETGVPLCDTDVQASLYVTYVYLDVPEHEAFLGEDLEYVIEQTQTTRAQPFAGVGANLGSSFSVPLPFSGPTRHLAWVLQSDEAARSKNWFHYGDLATGNDLLHSATIRVKNQDLFSPKSYLWFRGVVPKRSFRATPEKHIYVWAAGIDSRHAQCTGSINFNETGASYLDLTLQRAAYNTAKSYGPFAHVEPQAIHATVYAKVIKVLRVSGGRATIGHC